MRGADGERQRAGDERLLLEEVGGLVADAAGVVLGAQLRLVGAGAGSDHTLARLPDRSSVPWVIRSAQLGRRGVGRPAPAAADRERRHRDVAAADCAAAACGRLADRAKPARTPSLAACGFQAIAVADAGGPRAGVGAASGIPARCIGRPRGVVPAAPRSTPRRGPGRPDSRGRGAPTRSSGPRRAWRRRGHRDLLGRSLECELRWPARSQASPTAVRAKRDRVVAGGAQDGGRSRRHRRGPADEVVRQRPRKTGGRGSRRACGRGRCAPRRSRARCRRRTSGQRSAIESLLQGLGVTPDALDGAAGARLVALRSFDALAHQDDGDDEVDGADDQRGPSCLDPQFGESGDECRRQDVERDQDEDDAADDHADGDRRLGAHSR